MLFADPKSPFKSKTVWGGIIAAAPPILTAVGGLVGLTPADAAETVGHVNAIAAAVGGLLAIYGRVTAKAPIK